MSAKEMFEKLGYEEREETTSMFANKIYENKHFNRIYFDYDKKIDVTGLIIDIDLLQAINKQVEELKMELKIGNYIRTPKGIGKITNIYTGHNKQEDSGFCIDSCKEKFYCGRSAMKELKSSSNIMDLIEVGDYINGHIVEDLDDLGYITLDDDTIKYDDIKSIVTKESMESVTYYVK